MDEHTKSIHYLLMADHFMVQKALLSQIKDTELTMGQPKVLDYLKDHDGACQKDIAAGCHIEPASITAEETEELQSFLVRVYDNMKGSEKDNRKEERKR